MIQLQKLCFTPPDFSPELEAVGARTPVCMSTGGGGLTRRKVNMKHMVLTNKSFSSFIKAK